VSESHRRCRYYPDCSIHTGDPKPIHFSEANVREMRAMRHAGVKVVDIAREFGTYSSQVSLIVNGHTHRGV